MVTLTTYLSKDVIVYEAYKIVFIYFYYYYYFFCKIVLTAPPLFHGPFTACDNYNSLKFSN